VVSQLDLSVSESTLRHALKLHEDFVFCRLLRIPGLTKRHMVNRLTHARYVLRTTIARYREDVTYGHERKYCGNRPARTQRFWAARDREPRVVHVPADRLGCFVLAAIGPHGTIGPIWSQKSMKQPVHMEVLKSADPHLSLKYYDDRCEVPPVKQHRQVHQKTSA
jgi:hypothetical protein